MKSLLVVGGDGNMTGMGADRCPDDMKGLLQGLRNCARYNQIILHLSTPKETLVALKTLFLDNSTYDP